MKDFNELTIQELKDLNESIAKAIELREAEKKEAEIVPAGPLTEAPEAGEICYVVISPKPKVVLTSFDGYDFDMRRLEEGLLFPDGPEGKAGAELLAKRFMASYPENQDAILPEGHKPGFLGLVEVVGDDSGHSFPIGHEGAAFDFKHDPTKKEWSKVHPNESIVMLNEGGNSFLLRPEDYKFINR